MTGCAQGLVASLVSSGGGSPSGKLCTSTQVSLGCCTSTAICAPADLGAGATCSPISGSGWTYDC